jgi:hypothetical protein
MAHADVIVAYENGAGSSRTRVVDHPTRSSA